MKYIKVSNKFAIIDDEDFEKVSRYSWYLANGYAEAVLVEKAKWGTRNKKEKMHRLIMNPPTGVFIDHKNMNTLDNRKSNLRFATKSQNMMNRPAQKNSKSGIKGVCWAKREKMWRVYVRANKKIIYSSYHKELSDAVLARENAIIKYHGEFAHL